MHRALEFFAGSGLVRLGLTPGFRTVWANDVCKKKQLVYVSNHGSKDFLLADIRLVSAATIPQADLAWASFPCQDLSLAGDQKGMGTDTRSGLFWEWIRILWQLRAAEKLPSLLVVENVIGFLTASAGKHFADAYRALRELGYRVGAIVIDAGAFVPQSRPRTFLIAMRDGVTLDGLIQAGPMSPFHPEAVVRMARALNDPNWVWWSLPKPTKKPKSFSEVCERDRLCDPRSKTDRLLGMLSPRNKMKLVQAQRLGTFLAGTGYLRTRVDATGKSRQCLEVRFDGMAGCLRTPGGGSSRQTVLIAENGSVRSRLLTVRECARLMGAPDSFALPGTYNDGYQAMGDGVAVPVTRWLVKYLLKPLADRAAGIESQDESLEMDALAAGATQRESGEFAFHA